MATAPKKGQSARTRTTQGLSSTLQGLTDAVPGPVTRVNWPLAEQEYVKQFTLTGPAQSSQSPTRIKHGTVLWLVLVGLAVLSAFNAYNAYRLTKLPIIELRMVTPGDQT